MKRVGMSVVLLLFVLCGCVDSSDRIDLPSDLSMYTQTSLTDEQLVVIDSLVMTAVDWYNDTDHDIPFREIDKTDARYIDMHETTTYLLGLAEEQFGDDIDILQDDPIVDDYINLLRSVLPATGIMNSYYTVIMTSASEDASESWPKMRSAIITALEYYYDIEFEDEDPAA